MWKTSRWRIGNVIQLHYIAQSDLRTTGVRRHQSGPAIDGQPGNSSENIAQRVLGPRSDGGDASARRLTGGKSPALSWHYISLRGSSLRLRFLSDRLRLSVNRRSREALVGRVGLRLFGGWATWRSMLRSFSRQSATFRPASRKRWLVSSNSPCWFTRRRKACRNRCRTSSGRLGLLVTFQRSNALVFSLFTFCPPGPALREKLKSSSRSGIFTRSLTTSIGETTGKLTGVPPTGTKQCRLLRDDALLSPKRTLPRLA